MTRRSSISALLPVEDDGTLASEGMATHGAIKLKLEWPGHAAQIVEVREHGPRE